MGCQSENNLIHTYLNTEQAEFLYIIHFVGVSVLIFLIVYRYLSKVSFLRDATLRVFDGTKGE